MLLIYVILASVVLLVLVGMVSSTFWGSRKVTTVPGLDPSHPIEGNLADITKAGSIHEFLMQLHAEFGDIASFWMGEKLCVSISSAELFKEQNHVFDRPNELFMLVEPLLTMDSIQFANGADGRNRRKTYDQCFSHQSIISYYEIFQKSANELARKWKETPKDQHIALCENMFALTIKIVAKTGYGDLFHDDREVLRLKKNYDVCWSELERRALGEIPPSDSPRQKNFDQGKSEMMTLMKRALEMRKQTKIKEGHELLIDLIAKTSKSENQALSDCLIYLIGGIHTTSLWLTWALYFMATHSDVEEKAYNELIEVLEQENVTYENIGALKYLRQVLDETLRCSVLAPYAARYQNVEIELGGHKLPPGTPVMLALGVSLQNPEIWPEPEKFDPEHFSAEKVKSRSPYAYQPFGFAGKRKCPAYQFAYAEATVTFATLLRQFKIKLVEGQVVTPEYGFVTKPKEEIWITLEKRT